MEQESGKNRDASSDLPFLKKDDDVHCKAGRLTFERDRIIIRP